MPHPRDSFGRVKPFLAKLTTVATFPFVLVLTACFYVVLVLAWGFRYTGRGSMAVARFLETRVYMAAVHAKRWFSGEPIYDPSDTVYMQVQPKNAGERIRLEAWAKDHKRVVIYSTDGMAMVLRDEPFDSDCQIGNLRLVVDDHDDGGPGPRAA